MKKLIYILICLSLSLEFIGQTKPSSKTKKVKNDGIYKETVATIIKNEKVSEKAKLIPAMIFGYSSVQGSSVSWTTYSFTVKRKFNEYYQAEGSKSPNYDFTIWGEAPSGWEIGEKFLVKYDSTNYGSDDHYLVYYKPLFSENEKTLSAKGKIIKVYGMDKNYGGIGILFRYYIPTVNEKKDTVYTSATKYQYLPPELNITKIKADTIKEYKVMYSIENPKRAIIYYLQN